MSATQRLMKIAIKPGFKKVITRLRIVIKKIEVRQLLTHPHTTH